MKLSHLAFAAVLTVSIAVPAIAQPGPGGGPWKGYRFNQGNTPGWTLMSAEERAEFQQKMWSSKTYDECKAIQTEHHKLMEERAKAKNMTLAPPQYNACDRMKASGVIK